MSVRLSVRLMLLSKRLRERKKSVKRCPQCTNNQAFRWYSYSSGEHAGVKQDRIVEHFQCTQCRYLWGESR
jgi:hypothetical protein